MDTDRFKIVFQNSILSNPNIQLGNEFVLFPNPLDSNQGFTIKIVRPLNEGLVEIYNSIGQKIFSQTVANVDRKIEVRTENSLSTGVYLVAIKTAGKTSIQKLIVK